MKNRAAQLPLRLLFKCPAMSDIRYQNGCQMVKIQWILKISKLEASQRSFLSRSVIFCWLLPLILHNHHFCNENQAGQLPLCLIFRCLAMSVSRYKNDYQMVKTLTEDTKMAAKWSRKDPALALALK